MSKQINRRIVLASRPKGEPTSDNFRMEKQELPALSDGEILLKVKYLSIDPYMRGRMNAGKSYAAPVEIGDTMVGGTVAEVVESRHPKFKPGQVVLSYSGWQEYAISDGKGLRVLDPDVAPLSTALGVLGMPGFTAYSGLLTIGKPAPGETVVVAAATGPVGSAVGQIAKIKGARAVGIAGGPKKCAALIEEFGFDAAVDHRDPNFAAKLKEALPDGIDVYFENVGGEVWRAVQPLLNDFARVPVCGLVAHYNDVAAPEGPDRLPGLMGQMLSKHLSFQGFIQSDFSEQYPAFLQDMSAWLAEGRVNYIEDKVDGLENAPGALIGILKGDNFGKMIVCVD